MQISLSMGMCSNGGGLAGVNAQLAALLATALIPTRDGVLTTVSSATVDPITGAAVLANTPNGRTLNIGGYSFPGAALLAQRATSGLYGAASASTGLVSNSAAPGDYPTVRTMVENSGTSQHSADCTAVTLTDGLNYVASAYVRRSAGGRNVNIVIGNANFVTVNFNLDTGVVTNGAVGGNAVNIRSSMRLLPSGYWFIQATATSPAWGAAAAFRIIMATGTNTSYTGDGTSSLIISGYQVEQGEYASSPLAWDGGAGLTRAAASYSWAQALSLTAGTVVAVGMPYGWNTGQNTAIGRVYDAAGTGILFCNAGANGYAAQRTDSLVAINSAPTGAVSSVAGQQKVITQRFDATSNRITVDGVTVSSAAPTLPFAAATPLIIGNRAALDRFFDGWVSIILFNTALSDSDVALLTSYSSIV